MRVHAPIDDLIGGKTSVRVLRTLSLFPEKEFTGRELAALSKASPSNVITELERFKILGLVTRKTHGRTHAWKPNRDHVLFRMLAPVFEQERGLYDELLADIERGTADPRVSRVILFGSFARGDEAPRSDVDVLIVTKRAKDVESVQAGLAALSARLRNRFGLDFAPIVHAEQQLGALRGSALIRSIREEGCVIRGDPL